MWGVSLTHPMLAPFLSGEFLLHIQYWHHFYLGRFSYTSRAGFCFYQGNFPFTSPADFIILILGVSLTHPRLPLFSCGEFPLHIPRWLLFSLNPGSFSYTPRAGFNFMNGLSLRDPMLPYFCRGSFSYTSRASLTFIWGVYLTHPLLASISYWEFLLHIPCCLYFSMGSFPYTSRAGFFFLWIWGISLTHPVLALILSTDFLLEIRCCLIFKGGVSLRHPVLA